MRTTTLLALGLGAAAVTMMDPSRRKRMMKMMDQMTNNIEIADMMPSKRQMKKIGRRMMRNF